MGNGDFWCGSVVGGDTMVEVDKEVSKFKKKQRIRMLWKYYKIGKWDLMMDSVTEEELHVLRVYYHADV